MRYHERLRRLEEKDLAARKARMAALTPILVARLTTILTPADRMTLRDVLLRVHERERRSLTHEEQTVVRTVMADVEAWSLLCQLAAVVQCGPESLLFGRGEEVCQQIQE